MAAAKAATEAKAAATKAAKAAKATGSKMAKMLGKGMQAVGKRMEDAGKDARQSRRTAILRIGSDSDFSTEQ